MKARRVPSVSLVMVDPGRFEQPGECVIDGFLDQNGAVEVRKEGRGRPLRQRALDAFGGIGPQGVDELGTDRNEPDLVELRVAYGQDRVGQVDIVERQALSLAEPQPRAVEEQEQRAQGVGVELDRALPTDIDGTEQAPQFVTGTVNVCCAS